MMYDDHDDGMPADDQALTQTEYHDIFAEIEEQPTWRHVADQEMDYADGNQLDGELLRKQRELGIPPAIEDMIGPVLRSIQGYESASRADWRVTATGQPGSQDVANAVNFKLNEAERESKADAACSEAFRPQLGCGLGWVEVAKESDPFLFPYRCVAIHRNEIHWDMKARKPDLSDARWLRRQRWLTKDRIALAFPDHAELIRECGTNGPLWWEDRSLSLDGGSSTGLENAWNEGRAWTMQEDRWFNPTSKELCLAEVWYRRWVRVPVMRTPDGRVVEFDENNLSHNVAVASGIADVQQAVVTRVRRSYWLGPHMLHDGPSPYTHRHFPYVPFWGFREDNTGVPYGYVRGMKYAQDSLNSGNSKLRWGMAVTRVERTKGAVAMTDDQLRRQVARADADIVLDAEHMRQQGARFEVKRDYQLTDQHHQMLTDNRQTIERLGSFSPAFQGQAGTAQSGVQEQTQVEQSNQSLADMMDAFRAARRHVGELLMSLLIADMGSQQQEVLIEGNAVTPDRTVVLNAPQVNPRTGMTYLSNDLQRTRLKVTLEEVPSTSSYRAQQLHALTEAIKPLPPEYLAAAIPFLASLMDVPFRRELVEAFRGVGAQETPEQIEQRIKQAVDEALAKAGNDIKLRELEIKEKKAGSEIKNLDAKAVQIGVQAAFSAMQAGAQIAQMPMIAPVADEVMKSAGYQRPDPAGDDPNYPVADETAAMNIKDPYIQGQDSGGAANGEDITEVRQNTSPGFPPVPQDAGTGQRGIETPTTADNLPVGAEP